MRTAMSGAARGAVFVVCTAGAALGAIGCLLAAAFELQGFGTRRDAEPRTGYLLVLALGLGVCVGVPAAARRLLFSARTPAWPLLGATMAATALVAFALMALAGLRG